MSTKAADWLHDFLYGISMMEQRGNMEIGETLARQPEAIRDELKTLTSSDLLNVRDDVAGFVGSCGYWNHKMIFDRKRRQAEREANGQ